jgi:phosphoenolpyruvate carboxylase
MATQHPDNATAAYFMQQPYISAKDEIEECYRSFKDLGAQEYMWDWEGKFVDEAVIDRLFTQHYKYFKKNQIGKDIFLTFRIPNIWIESSHKLPRALMNMLSAEKAAKTYHLHFPPLFEIILPMAKKASELIYLQKTFHKIAEATKDIFGIKTDLKTIDIIPLFEEFDAIKDCNKTLHQYINFLKKEYKFTPKYIRAFTARSDTALNMGFLSAKLAIKIAINNYHNFRKETGIKVYPWVGGGCLPFRGGINPENIPAALDEYRGVSTLTVQSAFRYDYDLKQVKRAIKKLNTEIPKNYSKYDSISKTEMKTLINFISEATKFYKPIIESIAPIINTIALKLPSHRERVQHIGLFGYSRGLGKVRLPRAIKFTGSLYSLGVPPELIGSGKALNYAQKNGALPLITKLCPYLQADFKHSGHYLNRENVELLAKRYPPFKDIHKDIELIEKILKIKIGPQKPHHFIHRNFTSNIFHKLKLKEDFSEDVLKAAQIRKSLG